MLYYLAVENGIDQSSYFTFTEANDALMVTFMALSVVQIQPVPEKAELFFQY